MLLKERYELREQIATGGLGDTFRAVDSATGEAVAMKRLHRQYTDAAPERVAEFRAESTRINALKHPHIARVHDVVEQDGLYYVVMDYFSGGTLTERAAKQPITVRDVLRYTTPIADALAHGHRLGLVHQDVKPGNILFKEDDLPTLVEYGLPRIKLSKAAVAQGIVTGTQEYIAPEMLQTQQYSISIDVWAMGIMLFELLAGHRPFTGNDVMERFNAILKQPAPDLAALRSDIPPDLARLVGSLLVKDPAQRMSSAELHAALFALQIGFDA